MMRKIAFPLDAAVVLLFAALGRNAHNESAGILALLGTAWPFLTGLTVGWVASFLLRRTKKYRDLTPTSIQVGVGLWISTVCIGMLLRTLSSAGTAAPFIIVACVALGVGLLGWRVCYLSYARLESRRFSTASRKP